jgi:putative tricarboxylic transport membrane protein
MDGIFQNMLGGFAVVFSPSVLVYALLGCLLGTLVGVLPGVGPLSAMSLLLPVTFGLDPIRALILLSAIYYGAMYGGSTTSILMRIPGEAASVVTCLDGYAMAQKGRAGAALTISAVGSFFAGTIGVVGLMVLGPTLAGWALRFGPPEYFSLLVLGLTILCYMTGTSMAKSVAMVILGLMFGMVGIDRMTGFMRYDYGIAELGDGLGVVPIAVGLFGIAEILATASNAGEKIAHAPRLKELLPSREEWRSSLNPIGRGTILGFFIGVLPGPTHIVSSFVSYAVERRLSKYPERFGQGMVEGVAGPESANNAATSGSFIPMLALGVPSNASTAVMMAAIMIHGVNPGPMLLQEHPDLFWGFIASMYVGNLVLIILNLPLVGLFVNLLRIPYPILYPLILLFCLLGVYGINNSVVDVWIMVIMGLLGFVLRKFDFEVAPIVLGVVLAPMLEMSLRQSLVMSGGHYWIFLQRPIAAAFLGIVLLVLVISLTKSKWGWLWNLRKREGRVQIQKGE